MSLCNWASGMYPVLKTGRYWCRLLEILLSAYGYLKYDTLQQDTVNHNIGSPKMAISSDVSITCYFIVGCPLLSFEVSTLGNL